MENFTTLFATMEANPRPTVIVALVVVVICLVWAALVREINARDRLNEDRNPECHTALPRAAALFLYFTVGLSLLLIFMVFATFSLDTAEDRGFVTVATLILLGIAAFIAILNLLSRSAKKIGMIDARHPFGLPEGSVRAILTIAFIVLVGVLSAFLITSHNNRSPYSTQGIVVASGLALDRANALAETMRLQFGTEALVGVVQTNETPPAATAIFDVRLHSRVDNKMGDDIAKQTLTMISTILAAMIGFYFAERSGSARDNPAPDLTAGLKSQLMTAVTTAKSNVESLRTELARRAALAAADSDSDTEKARKTADAEAARKAQTGKFAALETLLAAAVGALENAAATPDALRKALTDAATINGTKMDDVLK